MEKSKKLGVPKGSIIIFNGKTLNLILWSILLGLLIKKQIAFWPIPHSFILKIRMNL